MELYLTLNTEERQLLGQQYPQEKQRMNQLTARWYEEGRLDGQLKTLIRLLTRRFGTLDKATEARLQGATQGELDRWTDSILTARSLEMGSSCGDVCRSLPPALLPRIDDGLPGRSECADITGSHRQPVGVRHGRNAGIIALNGYACISCSRQNVSVGRGA